MLILSIFVLRSQKGRVWKMCQKIWGQQTKQIIPDHSCQACDKPQWNLWAQSYLYQDFPKSKENCEAEYDLIGGWKRKAEDTAPNL